MATGASFYDGLIEEVLFNQGGLDGAAYRTLRRYYRALSGHPEQRAFYRYNWVRRTEPLAQVLEQLPARSAPWRVLDAGCGVGTEAMFMAGLRPDIAVLGVDIDAERLAAARARQVVGEHDRGRRFASRFERRNVFEVLRNTSFDVVWTMEAISHIDPAERFVQAVAGNLHPGGHLVISDSHIVNPAIAWRIWRLRRSGVAPHTHKTADTGELVDYAQERAFAVWQVRGMLRAAGFSALRAQMSVFFPPVLARLSRFFPLLCRLDRGLDSVPLLRYVGGIYTIVGTK